MRLSNKRKAPLYRFFYTLLVLILGMAVVFILMEIFLLKSLKWQKYLLVGIPIILVLLFIKRGRQLFQYDSDGEALNFINESVIPYLNRPLIDEFPKYKLINYEIKGIPLFKSLYVTVSSKKSNSLILKYDISYLTKKEIKDLKISLNRILKSNAEK